MSSRGVKQGDPLAPILFAIGIHDALVEISENFPKSYLFNYADDGNLFGEKESNAKAFLRLKELFAVKGLEINLKKCMSLSNNKSKSVVPSSHDGIKVLGAPIGNDEFVREQVICELTKEIDLLEVISEVDSVAAYQLLKFCIAAKPTYLIRSVHHSLTDEGSKLFDEAVSKCFNKLIQRPEASLQDYQKNIIHLPVKLGGIGIRSANRTRVEAYIASFSESFSFFEKSRSLSGFLDEIRVSTQRGDKYMIIDESQKNLMEVKNKVILTETGAALVDLPYNNGKAAESQAWLKGPFSCFSKFNMKSFNFVEALNLKLLFPVCPPKEYRCDCKIYNKEDPFHFLNCFYINGLKTHRHDAIKVRLADFMKECDPRMTINKEQAIPLKKGKKKAVICDIATISSLRSHELIDVSFVNSAATTYLDNKDPLEKRCMKKFNHYRVSLDNGSGTYTIVPFVMDITGKLHQEARRFIERVARMSDSPLDRGKFKRAKKAFLRDISIISMNENGNLIRSGKLYYSV